MAAFPALRHRNFRLYYGGQLFSLVGTWMQQVAMGWLVYRLTGSPWLLGLVNFANRAPVFFLGLGAGVLADRLDRRRLLLVTQGIAAVQALALGVVTIVGLADETVVLLFALALGLVYAVDIPTRQAFVGDLVPPDDLPSAVGMHSSAVHLARIIGPAVAGWVVSRWGEGIAFLLNGLSFAAVMFALLQIRTVHVRPERQAAFRRQLYDGLHFIRHDRPVRATLTLVALVSFVGVPFIVLLPVLVGRHFGGDAGMLGLLMTASGIGALGSALLMATASNRLPLQRWMRVHAGLMGLGLLALGLGRSFGWAFAALVLTGYGMIGALAGANAWLQTHVAPELRGRVMSVYSMALVGVTPFGGLLAGGISEALDVRTVIAASGGLLVVAVLIGRFGAGARHSRSLSVDAGDDAG